MIRPATKALGLDALYQVLDNWVFRILAVAALLPVLVFSLVHVTRDELRLLFGVWSWPLDEVVSSLPILGDASEPQAAVIGLGLDFLIFSLGGSWGVLFCLVATSFFVPRMMERGSADVLFHKPVSRLRFFLSRYVAGILFVFLLAMVSCTGAFLALAAFSGFVDAGIFAMAPALTYVYVLVFPVSMLVGVLTRSTVAAILLTALFFLGNGCVHSIWIQKESVEPLETQAEVPVLSEDTPGDGEVESIERAAPLEVETSETPVLAFFQRLEPAFDALHFVLPKTSDTPYLAAKLRRAANRPEWVLEGSTLELGALPDGWTRLSEDRLAAEAPAPSALDAATTLGTPRVGATRVGATRDGDPAMAVFARPEGEVRVERSNGTVRMRDERVSDAIRALLEALRSAGSADAEEVLFLRQSEVGDGDGSSDGESTPILALRPGIFARMVSWTEPDVPGARFRALVLEAEDTIVTLVHRSDAPQPIDPEFQELASRLGYGEHENRYGKLLTFDAPWRTNVLQSVGSSLAFAVLVLVLGAWRLSRVDF